MNYSRTIHAASALLAMAASQQIAKSQISFVPGNDYTANYFSQSIMQYTPDGTEVGALNLPEDIHGIAFGQDSLLYATSVQGPVFGVLALNSSGAIQQTYPMTATSLGGGLSTGKIAVDAQHIYVTGGNQLTAFTLGQPGSGTVIYQNNQVFDVNILSDGNLLVASAYTIQEITSTGQVVRTIPGNFTDIRGIAYDASSDSLFVTELGSTGAFFQLLRLDGTTGDVQASTTFNYGDDMFLTADDKLLVGSRTQPAGIFDEDLNQIGTLGGNQQMFVTSYVTPEPNPSLLASMAGLIIAASRQWRRKG